MTDKHKKALMYGAGGIGRGFLGQLFAMSGYEICFIDVDEKLVSHLNKEKKYVITIAAESGYKSQTINNVRAVNGMDAESTACEISNCDIMATAVGVNILPRIVKTIAAGIEKRLITTGGQPLDIIVCENISDGGNYLKELVAPYIQNKFYFEDKIGFVSASVGRMVPVSTDADSSEIIVESYNELPIDADALKSDVSDIQNFIPVTPFAIEKYKKYYMHNMSHVIVAYLGFINGHDFLWEAMADAFIRKVAKKALAESIQAISVYFSIATGPLEEYADDLLTRYSNKYLKDTVLRVGRDPKRKLASNDRLTGAALFCLKNGINPDFILYGIAAAFCFDSPDDVSSPEIIRKIKESGIKYALEEFTGIKQTSLFYDKILNLYLKLKNK